MASAIALILVSREQELISKLLNRQIGLNDKEKEKCLYIAIIFIVLVLVCNIVPLYMPIGQIIQESANGNVKSFNIENDSIYNISIDRGYHHIGDVNNSDLFPESPNTEGYFYVKDFVLPYKTKKMFITMMTRDVDPDIKRGPASIYLNNKFLCYLNQFVKTERIIDGDSKFIDNRAFISIEVDPALFNKGWNNIMIIVGNGKEEMLVLYEKSLFETELTNIDDIQFWNIEVKLEGKKI